MPIIFPDSLFNVERWKAFKGKYPPGSDIDHRIIIVFKRDDILKYFYVTSQVEKSRALARNDLKSLVCINVNDWAWECDVNKAEGANDACIVYKRTPASPEWYKLQIEKHPVEKNGLFVFEPHKYNYDQLGIIQKDNQNTVTISTSLYPKPYTQASKSAFTILNRNLTGF